MLENENGTHGFAPCDGQSMMDTRNQPYGCLKGSVYNEPSRCPEFRDYNN
jgi:hypothetical protein